MEITCEAHGASTPIMACVHIGTHACRVIYTIPPDGDEPQTAWCDICEEARLQDRGWYDHADSVAQWGWLCAGCLAAAASAASELVQVANPTHTPDERQDI